ncbi:MAG: DMT family transporter [Betaproteobacteria bacterium]
MLSDSAIGVGLALASLTMFSVNVILTRMAMSRLRLDVGFLVAVTVNVLFGLLLFAIGLIIRAAPPRWDAHAFWLFALSGVFTTYLGRWFFFETVARLGPAKASVFQISSPMFTALIAWVVLGERLSFAIVAAMIAVMTGLYFASVSPLRGVAQASGPRGHPHGGSRLRTLFHAGMLLGLGSSLAYAVGNVVRGAAIHRWQEPVLGALLGAASGLLLHVTFSRATRDIVASLRGADRRGILLYVVCGVLTISAQMLTIASMALIPVSIAALITLCTPIIVIPLSRSVFGTEEPITARLLFGSAFALAGIAVIVLR